MSKVLTFPQSVSQIYLRLMDALGGPDIKVPITIDAKGFANLQGVTIDTTNIFNSDALVATVDGVNLNSTAEQQLYTVPSNYSLFIPTRVVCRNASVSLTTAAWGFGFDAGTDQNVITSATHTELTGNTLFTILIPKIGAAIGVGGSIFSTKPTIAQGAPATASFDIWGCLVK